MYDMLVCQYMTFDPSIMSYNITYNIYIYII